MSPLQIRREAWTSEWHKLTAFLDTRPTFRGALADLRKYHELTEFVNESPRDFAPYRFWHEDGRLSLLAFDIERRRHRLNIKHRKPPEGVPAEFEGCPLAAGNIFWQQSGRQFPYPRQVNGNAYNWLVQVQSFGREHFTIASAHREPQDWRPSLTRLYRRVMDACTICALLGCLVLYNGDGAGDSIPEWFHLHGLGAPEDGPLPIQQAAALAGPPRRAVTRIDEPTWPLVAFRIAGPAEAIAGEVARLAERATEIAGEHATESIALYMEDSVVNCIYVPRDRRREWVEEFGGKPGSFEAATGSLVFSDPELCAMLRQGRVGFSGLWYILRTLRPEWSDEV